MYVFVFSRDRLKKCAQGFESTGGDTVRIKYVELANGKGVSRIDVSNFLDIFSNTFLV